MFLSARPAPPATGRMDRLADRRRPPRSTRVVAALLLTTAVSLLTASCSRPAPVSLLLVTIDTLRADHLGCYGYPQPTSPRIDRLAAEGTLFERAHTSLPRTTQSVASILTGRYPQSHGARGLFSKLSATNRTLAEILKDSGYSTAAVTSNMFLRAGQGFAQGFDLYDNPRHRWEGDSATEITSRALQWLDSRPPREPFFLWVHYLDPHWTYLPGPPFDRAFDPDFSGKFAVYDDLATGQLTKGQIIFENTLEPRLVEHLVALYDGEIAQVDAALAPLLDRVESRPDATLVVLTSDHGESLGEHDYFFAHGEFLYQQGLHIPLIFRQPGTVPAGLRVDALALNIDIAPTILALLGVAGLQSVDGRPLLHRPRSSSAGAAFQAAPGRTTVFAESDYQLIHAENKRYYLPGAPGKWSAASDGWRKLVHIPRSGEDLVEYYDLRADPEETRDLGRAAGASEEFGRLLRDLRRFVDYDTGPPQPRIDTLDPQQRELLRSLGYIN